MEKKMKRIKIVTFLLFFLSSKLIAGEFSGLGLKLGYNSSIFTGKDIPGKGVSSQPGVTIGCFICYEFDQMFSIQQEVLITTKGSKINTVGDVYLSNIFMYFELPLLAKMTFRSEHQLRPYIYLGPAFGRTIVALNNVGILENIRGSDFSVVLGTGIEVWKIHFEIRFNKGLLNFDQSADDIELKNSTFSILMGFSF
jgi:hypothetical protein